MHKKRVTNEICRDLRSPQHMQRLLQGDVGSGKTVVAAIALYATVTAGFQRCVDGAYRNLGTTTYGKLATAV